MTPQQLGPAVEAFVGLVRAHASATRGLSADLLEEHGLTLNDYECLLRLTHAPGGQLRRVDLSRELLLTPSGITRLLEGLERAGYVERRNCAADARVSYAVLTPAGREKLKQARRSHVAQVREHFGARLSDEELATLASLLARLESRRSGRSVLGRMSEPDPRRWKALALLSIAYLMVVLDIAIVNVALPTIQDKLNFSSTENLQWIVSGYALTFGGLLLLGGRMGDILGRRRVFMVGLALFALTSLIAGLSTSSAMLIAARVAQGAAGAILSPSVFSITSVTFAEGSERNKALGVLGAISGAGAAIGVILGGVLTTYAGWEWIFFVNVPIGLITLFLVPRVVAESRAEGMERHFDFTGAALVTGGLMLFVYALTRTNQVGWSSTETILEFIGSALLIGGFILWEGRTKYALVPLRIFKRRTLTGANIVGFLLGTMIFGMFFLLSLYMQQVLGFTALKTGIGYLAVALTAVVASGAAQALVTKTGVKPALLGGLTLVGGGLVLFTQISPTGSYMTDLFPGFIILGTGLGFTFVPISIAALAGVTGRDAGLASGLINTSQQIGGALGLALLTTVATSHISKLAPNGNPTPADLTSGYSLAFWVAAGVAAAAIVVTLVIVRKQDLELAAAEAAAGAVG